MCTQLICGADTVINFILVAPLRVLESDLHLAMKDAVVRHLVDGELYLIESSVWYTGLRVDVEYRKNGRNISWLGHSKILIIKIY